MHPETWGLLGVQFEGTFYVSTYLPFGLAPGRRIFTEILAVMYKLPRELGWAVTAMIDDAARASLIQMEARWRSLVTALQEAALGAVHNRD